MATVSQIATSINGSGSVTFSSAPLNGDWLIAFGGQNGGLPTVAAGWTSLANGGGTPDAPSVQVAYRQCATGESATQTPFSASIEMVTVFDVTGGPALWSNLYQAITFASVGFTFSETATATASGQTLALACGEVFSHINGGVTGITLTGVAGGLVGQAGNSGTGSYAAAGASAFYPSGGSVSATCTWTGQTSGSGVTTVLLFLNSPPPVYPPAAPHARQQDFYFRKKKREWATYFAGRTIAAVVGPLVPIPYRNWYPPGLMARLFPPKPRYIPPIRKMPYGSGILKVPVAVTEVLTGGQPLLRAPLSVLEQLTGGQPKARASLAVLEQLTGGQPKARVGLVALEVLTVLPENPWAAMLVFPTLRGRSWSTHKQPKFATRTSDQQSGQEVRSASYQYPKWEFDLVYDYLPESVALTDYRTLLDFFLQCQGGYQYFLFRDYRSTAPNEADYQVRGGYLGTADGVTLQYPFSRQFVAYVSAANPGGFLEPVGQVDLSTIATFLPAAVNTGASTIAIPNHGLTTATNPLFVSETGGALPTPLAASTPYWAIVVDANTIKLAKSAPAALANTAITLTGTGTGTFTLAKGFAVYETVAESDSVPGTPGPYTITVAQAASYISDGGVTLAGVPLTVVASAPAANQYSVNTTTGVYTFNAAQQAAAVVITYTYLVSPSAYSILMPNQLLFGSAPTSGLILTADFDFYFVCRFLDDVADFENFGNGLWNLQKCNFISVPTNPAP